MPLGASAFAKPLASSLLGEAPYAVKYLTIRYEEPLRASEKRADTPDVRSLRSRLLVMVLVTALLPLCAPGRSEASMPWWDGSFTDRSNLLVIATDAVPTAYSLAVTVNHAALVSAGSSQADGDDVRLLHWDGATWTELDRLLDPDSAWNTTTTKLWFKTRAAINAAETDSSYFVYFANASASMPPANGDNVFTVYDDFEDGVVDLAKWTRVQQPGVTVTESGGETVIAGAGQAGTGDNFSGLYVRFNNQVSGYAVDSRVRAATMGTNVGRTYKAEVGARTSVAAIDSNNSTTKSVRYYTTGWNTIGTSTAQASAFSSIRILQTVAPTTGDVKHFEDGVQIGSTRTNYTPASTGMAWTFAPETDSDSFDWRVGFSVLRKFVSNEPTVSIGGQMQTQVAIEITPNLTFALAGVTAGVACGSSLTTNATSTDSSLSLTSVRPDTNRTACQQLTAATNATGGYSVSMRHTGALSGPSGPLPDLAGGASYASPTAFPSAGVSAFGFSTDDDVSGGTADRFYSPSRAWAPIGTTNVIVATESTPVNETTNVAFQAGVSGTQGAGIYSTVVVYTVAANF